MGNDESCLLETTCVEDETLFGSLWIAVQERPL
jgi:hypothetical protein